jgi:hypothetical protein
MRAAAFERAHPFALLKQEILQGPEQEGPKPAFFLIGSAQRVVLKYMLKKTLDDILRITRRIAAATDECIKRWPISFAETGERFSRLLIRFRLARLQNDRPMRRLERRTTLLQRSGNRLRRRVS